MDTMINFNSNGLVPSPFHIVNRYCDKNWYVSPAPRDFHNFMLVVSGEGIAHTDGTEKPMRPGTLIYHHPGQVFGFDTSKSNLMHCFGVNFYLASVTCNSGEWDLMPTDKLPFDLITPVSDMDILIKLFTDLYDSWFNAESKCTILCRSIFMQILNELSRQALISKGNVKGLKTIEYLTSYIRNNYSQPINLEKLAERVNLNPNYLGSIFKKYTGQTPIDYLNAIRIQKSEEFLSIGFSVSETSVHVGFKDPFYFSKVFK